MIDNHKTRLLKAKIQEFFNSKLVLDIEIAIAQGLFYLFCLFSIGFSLAIIYKVFNYFK